MRYAGIIKNDLAAAPGVSLTFFTQGCSRHCPDCHNPCTWDFNGGKEFKQEVLDSIIENLYANGIKRTFCVMGGEPLDPENVFLTDLVISNVKEALPDVEIYLWTGYKYEDLRNRCEPRLKSILDKINVLVDGEYKKELRDITKPMIGSTNQRILTLNK